MSGHVPGLVSTCFRSLGSAYFLADEEWMFFLILASRLQQLLNISKPHCLDHSSLSKWLT